ncbi:MAG: hypothetical protein JSS06_06855 [Proteobacteria bacterium]|nr:hypothetical protein [Pseudomonadota bacterium]
MTVTHMQRPAGARDNKIIDRVIDFLSIQFAISCAVQVNQMIMREWKHSPSANDDFSAILKILNL